jgi:uncharacterized protein (UPF0276 family)
MTCIVIPLAVTDSPIARTLLEESGLDIDYLEVHGPYADSARDQFPDYPMLLHNALYEWSLAHPDALRHGDAESITARRLEQTASPWLSVHLGFSATDVMFRDCAMQAASAPLPEDGLLKAMHCTVLQLRDSIGVPLLLENLDYNPTGAYEHICLPAFIDELVTGTSTFLLLDLAHAEISATALAMPMEDYLAALPLDRVRQIHVSGPRWRDGRLRDVHEPLRDEDYMLLQQILEHTQPWAVTLEYTRDANLLCEQIERLRDLLTAVPDVSPCHAG